MSSAAKNMAELRAQCTTPWVGPSSQLSTVSPVIWVFLGHLFLVRHFVDFQQCPVPGATFKGIARPNPSADRRAESNTDSPQRLGPVLDFATENKDPHFSTILGPQYMAGLALTLPRGDGRYGIHRGELKATGATPGKA